LTSASWLDVEYGFHLQRWILTNFEIIGVLESICEPWFTGARVATAVTVLRRCNDSQRRMQNVVKFVQLRKPLKELLEHDGTEVGRQEAVERLRELIEKTTEHRRTNAYRILAIPQEKLWQDGCYLKRICRDRNVDEPSETETTSSRSPSILREEPNSYGDLSDYLGSKWGVYLRAPDLYFELMERFGGAFVPLGEIADIRYGFKSGCDAFFTPTDISAEALEVEDAAEFRHRYHCSQQEVRTGKLRIIRAGDGSEHPVERKYLSREVHSLMSIEGVRLNDDIERVILLVNEPVQALKGTYVLDYLKYGERENFGADTTVPNRDTCAARPLWYDLTNYPTGRIILPIIVQYRHIVSWNPDSLPVNHALMAVDCKDMERNKALAAVLNSTLIAFIKPYFSRKLGNEANTQLDVYAANILPMPNVMKMPDMMIERLAGAFDGLGSRAILQLVEQRFLDIKHPKDLRAQETEPRELPIELQQPDRQRLDRAVLSAIGVSSAEQEALLDKLYREVTRFWNEARVVEIQAIENRKRSRRGRSTNAREVAAEIFSQLEPSIIRSFPDGFLPTDEVLETVELPEGRAKLFDAHDLYDANVLAVGNTRITLRHRPQAELAKFYCDLGRTGFVKLPISEASCISVKNGWIQYVTEMQDIFRPLATERTADEDQIEAIAAELERMLYRPDRETS
jgi:hypothetical protein